MVYIGCCSCRVSTIYSHFMLYSTNLFRAFLWFSIVTVAHNFEFMHYEEAHHLFGLFFPLYFLLYFSHTQTTQTLAHLMLDITIPYSIFYLLSHIEFFVPHTWWTRFVKLFGSQNTTKRTQQTYRKRGKREHRIPSFRLRIHLLNMHCVPLLYRLVFVVAFPYQSSVCCVKSPSKLCSGYTQQRSFEAPIKTCAVLILAHDKGRRAITQPHSTGEKNPKCIYKIKSKQIGRKIFVS